MSQYQSPFDPLNYATPQLPQPNPRPASVTVFAILAIIFGSLGMLGTLYSMPQYLGLKFGPNPVMDAIRQDRLLVSLTLGGLVVGFSLALLQLISGVGMLSLRPAALKGIIWYAILDLVRSILTIILNLAVMNPRLEEVTRQAMQSNPQLNTPQMKAIMQYSSYGGVCLLVVLLIWPILILVFMRRPHVKAAFADARLPPA